MAFLGLLIVVVGVFSWAAYQAAHGGALVAARARVEAVTAQVASILVGNVESFRSQRTAAADDPRVTGALATPSPSTLAALQPYLDSLAASPTELRTLVLHAADGTVVARAGRAADEATPPLPTAPEAVAAGQWASAFQRYGPTLGFAVTVRVPGASGTTVGFLVHHVELTATPDDAGGIADLIGEGASLVLGTPGGIWIDLVDEVPSPPEGLALQGPAASYENAEGHTVLGAGAPVAGTPWIVRVEFPEDGLLAAPRALLARLFPLGLLVLAGGAAAGWGLSHRITRRLDRLSGAAAAIADGDYQRRVPEEGDDELTDLARAFNSMAQQVEGAHERLESEVAKRTAELRGANRELEAFSYSVSHDLRAPLRAIHGFSRAVMEDHGAALPEAGRADLARVCAAAERMGALIDDLLALSRTTRAELRHEPLDLTAMATDIVADLRHGAPDRDVDVRIADGLVAQGDHALMRLVLRNLLENAWKFTARQDGAVIEFARSAEPEGFVVRDNGAGFDADYAHKLFKPFQRLHSADEFEGSGVGLALSLRILERHGGRLWAEGSEGQGAAFHFTLPGGAP